MYQHLPSCPRKAFQLSDPTRVERQSPEILQEQYFAALQIHPSSQFLFFLAFQRNP